MKTRAVLLAVIVGLASASAIAADQILTFTNLGPVRIGMTLAEAEAALHTKLKSVYPDPDKSCWFGNRADGIDGLTSYWIEHDKVVAIDIDDHEWPKPGTSVPPVATERGIRIGSPKVAVKDVYRSSPITDEQNSDRNSINLLSPDKQYGIAFDVTSGTVSHIRAGTAEHFFIDEPCT